MKEHNLELKEPLRIRLLINLLIVDNGSANCCNVSLEATFILLSD